MGAAALPLDQTTDVALRLADEGVPLRAIARATRIPSGDLREELLQAQADGRLLLLPHDDWPPGFPREQRALQLSRQISHLATVPENTICLTIGRVFGVTATEAKLLLLLLQNHALDKNRDDMAANTVDVHVFHIRKRLQPYGIEIITIWGFGYQLSARDRKKAMSIILQRVAAGTSR